MVDYTITGFTQTNDFRVYTGETPYNVVLYGSYKYTVTSVTIKDVPFNFQFYLIFEDIITGTRTSKFLRVDSAYCEELCPPSDGFYLDVTYPTPVTPTITPSVTATPILPTPTITPTPTMTRKVAASPTPTPSLTPSSTLAITPTPSNTPSPVTTPSGCGYYQVTLNYTPNPKLYMYFTYTDCALNREVTDGVMNFNTGGTYICVVEINGEPQISIPADYISYVSINRISDCSP